MNCGRVIKIFPSIVPNIQAVQKEMQSVIQFRQYKVCKCTKEPRLHALFLSSRPDKGGFKYERVAMESHRLHSFPVISKVADNLASRFQIENNQWNIGCHLVIYWDGKDSINWHADKTQGKDAVVSLIVESPPDAQTLCLQPANGIPLQEGDEQIELFPISGNAYSMDRAVQHEYVHAMLTIAPWNQWRANGNHFSKWFYTNMPRQWVEHWKNWSTSSKSKEEQIRFPWRLVCGRKLLLSRAPFQLLCTPQWLRQHRRQHENRMPITFCLPNGGQKIMWFLWLFDVRCWLQFSTLKLFL